MTILDFVTQDELDNLDEDPRMAFMTLVNHAQRRLSQQAERLDPNERSDWDRREELRHSFMNVVVAAAKRLEIEPFVSMDVPRQSNFGDKDYMQFKADLDHYITQLMLDNSIRSRQTSVEILHASKEKIRNYIRELRTCVENGNMPQSKRNALLEKLDRFEKELEKRRTSMVQVALLTYQILSVPGAVWASTDITHKLIHNVMHIVAIEKAREDETKQIGSSEAPKALSSPRPNEKAHTQKPDLDDEIPF